MHPSLQIKLSMWTNIFVSFSACMQHSENVSHASCHYHLSFKIFKREVDKTMAQQLREIAALPEDTARFLALWLTNICNYSSSRVRPSFCPPRAPGTGIHPRNAHR